MRLNLQIFACCLWDPPSLSLWQLTLLPRVSVNSLRKANPTLKPRIHRDPIGLVGLKAAYQGEIRSKEMSVTCSG